MTDLGDYSLNTGNPDPPPPPVAERRQPPTAIIAGVVALLVLAGGAYWWLNRGPQGPADEGTTATTEAVPPAQPAGPTVEPITESLDQSDPIVRALVAELTSHPRVMAWLATNGLIRNFVVSVENVSMGMSPARHLQVLRPTGPFRVLERDGEIAVDPRSYDRYTSLADAVASVDARGAATLYARLKPRIQEAYGELGHQEPFDAALERAIVTLLRAPRVEATQRLAVTGATQFKYADPALEGLNGAQKQLLRMGPANAEAIQAKLREIALALGIPAARLP